MRNLFKLRMFNILITFNTFIKFFFSFSRNHNMNSFRFKTNLPDFLLLSFSRLNNPFIPFFINTTNFVMYTSKSIESTVAVNKPCVDSTKEISSGRITTSIFSQMESEHQHIQNPDHIYSLQNL